MSLRYYLAQGRSKELVEAWIEKQRTYRKWAQALADEFKATNFFTVGRRLFGFEFKDNPPKDLWRQHREYPEIWIPNGRTKAGKAVAQRMTQGPPWPNTDELTVELIGSAVYSSRQGQEGLYVASVGIECLDGDLIILVPDGTPWDVNGVHEPPDATLLKNSEYWLLKEAQEAKEKGHGTDEVSSRGEGPAS